MPQEHVTKRTFLKTIAGAALWPASARPAVPASADSQRNPGAPLRNRASGDRPNIIVVLADDLGYGDVGCYGSRIPTPNIDRMAGEGVRLGQCYAASPVCSPSRASLLTGRYPTRVGIPRVMLPSDDFGLPDTETTLPQILKSHGYRTSAIGKWHLGTQPQYLPTSRGFDEYFGIPYSNDMLPRRLLRNTAVADDSADLGAIEQRYVDEAVRFISSAKDGPFFLYLATHAPHIPLVRGGKQPMVRTGLGPYGDMVAEVDWTVGQVLRAIADNGLDENTLVVFTSDNGPWYQGSAGALRGRKGSTWDGGVRIPFVARFPGRIPAGLSASGVASLMDLLPTLADLAGAARPANPLDGVDIWPMLTGEAEQVDREPLLYFDSWHLQCARLGPWKLHVSRYNTVAWGPSPECGRINLPLPHPELYNLEADPGETCDLAPDQPDLVADLRARIENALGTFPADVTNAWYDTMRRPVWDTPAGALPEPRTVA